MAKKPDNDAANSTPALTYTQRLEQALFWATYELECDASGHGGVSEAISDLVPEFNTSKLAKKGYKPTWPESYNE